MCNNYATREPAAEVARTFQVDLPDIAPFNLSEDIYPRHPGMVAPATTLVGFGTRPEAIKLFPVVAAL
jgi:hypothetical protein